MHVLNALRHAFPNSHFLYLYNAAVNSAFYLNRCFSTFNQHLAASPPLRFLPPGTTPPQKPQRVSLSTFLCVLLAIPECSRTSTFPDVCVCACVRVSAFVGCLRSPFYPPEECGKEKGRLQGRGGMIWRQKKRCRFKGKKVVK